MSGPAQSPGGVGVRSLWAADGGVPTGGRLRLTG